MIVVNYIPNYEGQPMIQTLMDQMKAAGGTFMNDVSKAEIILFVNNFSTTKQLEASQQPTNGSIADFKPCEPFLTFSGIF